MRLVTVRTGQGLRAGIVQGEDVLLLDEPDVGAVLAGGRRPAPSRRAPRIPLAGANLAPVVPHPEKVYCVGLNYEPHIREMGRELPSHPTLFAKFASALTGPRDLIVLPPESVAVDWEVELALVIGQSVRRADERAARLAIAGYTVLNDVTMRDWQARTTQFLQGKTWERSTPVGPALVTLDELSNPDDLAVRTEVDGKVMQDARTSDLLFGPVDLVRYISTFSTLRPGDLIATGTPGGVGAGRQPPAFLQPGNVVRCSVEGVGELMNRCVAEND
jgi:acylpyruvate hydrolase